MFNTHNSTSRRQHKPRWEESPKSTFCPRRGEGTGYKLATSCSGDLVISETHIKTKRGHSTPPASLESKRKADSNRLPGAREENILSRREQEWGKGQAALPNSLAVSHKRKHRVTTGLSPSTSRPGTCARVGIA